MSGFDVQYFSEVNLVSVYAKKVKFVFNLTHITKITQSLLQRNFFGICQFLPEEGVRHLWIGQTMSVGISEYSGLNILPEIDQV